mgnify:CR=1 FL=1|jgi:hypothetical protein
MRAVCIASRRLLDYPHAPQPMIVGLPARTFNHAWEETDGTGKVQVALIR